MKRGAIAGLLAVGVAGLALAMPGNAPAQKATSAVINGTPAEPSAYPSVGFLRLGRDRRRFPDVLAAQCGVVLVRPTVALTAAHCVSGFSIHMAGFIPPQQLMVVFGKRRLAGPDPSERIGVAQISVPISFFPSGKGDVAILRLEQPATVMPAMLPGPAEVSLGDAGTPVSFVGWGDSSRRNPLVERSRAILRVGGAYVVPCRLPKGLANFVGPGGLCVGGTRQVFCYGDSGGPGLVASSNPAQPFVVGLVSSGTRGCKLRGSRVFTGLLPQSPYSAFVNERVDNPDLTPAVVQVNPPLPDPVPLGARTPIRLEASEPVRANCKIGRRGFWFPCLRGAETTGRLRPRRAGSYLLRVIAFDQSFNRTYYEYRFGVG